MSVFINELGKFCWLSLNGSYPLSRIWSCAVLAIIQAYWIVTCLWIPFEVLTWLTAWSSNNDWIFHHMMCWNICVMLMFACFHVYIVFIVVSGLICTLSASTIKHTAEVGELSVTDRHWLKLPSCCPRVTSASWPHGCLKKKKRGGGVLYSLITFFSLCLLLSFSLFIL